MADHVWFDEAGNKVEVNADHPNLAAYREKFPLDEAPGATPAKKEAEAPAKPVRKRASSGGA